MLEYHLVNILLWWITKWKSPFEHSGGYEVHYVIGVSHKKNVNHSACYVQYILHCLCLRYWFVADCHFHTSSLSHSHVLSQRRIHVWSDRHRPPFWQINHVNSAYFRLFWGYFQVISAIRSPFWISAPSFYISWIRPWLSNYYFIPADMLI